MKILMVLLRGEKYGKIGEWGDKKICPHSEELKTSNTKEKEKHHSHLKFPLKTSATFLSPPGS
jgi:hypothetical protein